MAASEHGLGLTAKSRASSLVGFGARTIGAAANEMVGGRHQPQHVAGEFGRLVIGCGDDVVGAPIHVQLAIDAARPRQFEHGGGGLGLVAQRVGFECA